MSKPHVLNISEDLKLPIGFVTETQTLLAKRRKGKSYTAMVQAEELTKAGQPWVALDPMGAWWGLRAGRDGTKAGGLPVLVCGGKRGQLPLEPGGGRVLADLVMAERTPVVLDLSELVPEQQHTFGADFIERLYHATRDPLHVFIDEADEFVPQTPRSEEHERVRQATDRLIRRGGQRGIGATLISQRPQVIDKSTVNQTELLVCLGFTGPGDIDEVVRWFKGHGLTKEQLADFRENVSKLHHGMAYVSSPAWLEFFGRVQVRPKETFDSSATPAVGVKRREPRSLAGVDLARWKDALAETIAKAEAQDPAKLREQLAAARKELADAQKQLAARAAQPKVRYLVKEQHVKRLESAVAKLHAAGELAVKAAGELGPLLGRSEFVGKAMVMVAPASVAAAKVDVPAYRTPIHPPSNLAAPPSRPPPVLTRDARPASAPPDGEAPTSRDQLDGPARKILDAYAYWHAMGVAQPSRESVAALAGYSNVRSSGFRNPLYACQSHGLVRDDALTDAGRHMATWPAEGTDLAKHHAHLRKVMDGPERKLFDALHAGGGRMTRDQLTAATEYTNVRSSGFRNPLYKLSSMGVVELKKDDVTATALMYPAALVTRQAS
ncbi:MAG TPA: hypothetical protein VK324_04485 [Tepidisphaeraceae bacterium]|nr:hypothetical protein [Tepidisphaeraceae bacterium]